MNPIRTLESTLDSVVEANERIRYYDLTFDPGLDLIFDPGQFVSVYMPSEPRPISRPYSIASTPDEARQGLLKLVVTEVQGGKVSPWIHGWKKGHQATIKGPFGSFTLPEELPEELHFVSVGTGIAPFRSMILHLVETGRAPRMTLYHGNRHEDSILYDDEFRALAEARADFTYIPCVSRPSGDWVGARGYVQDQVQKHVGEPGGKLVMICGINAMIDDVCKILNDKGFPETAVHFERYD